MKIQTWVLSSLLVLASTLPQQLSVAAEATAPADTAVHVAIGPLAPSGLGAKCGDLYAADLRNVRLLAFTNAEIMADMASDPAEMLKLMERVLDPQTLAIIAKCATEPALWDKWMQQAANAESLIRAAQQLMDEDVMAAWMAAPSDPEVHAAMLRLMDPTQQLTRWMTVVSDPMIQEGMMSSFMHPSFYMTQFQWFMKPHPYAPFSALANETAQRAHAVCWTTFMGSRQCPVF